ncbi:MAG: hypothetical protein KJ968_01575 [Nanoarchaeota archaeon]|nr:hypothetical protein [Nanoarchaeota archaeon]
MKLYQKIIAEYKKLKDTLLDIVVGPQKTIRIDEVYVGSERNVGYNIPTGIASGSPGVPGHGTTKGRDITIKATELQTEEVLTGKYIAYKDINNISMERFFPEEKLETLLQLEGQNIKIRMKKYLPDYLIQHMLNFEHRIKY